MVSWLVDSTICIFDFLLSLITLFLLIMCGHPELISSSAAVTIIAAALSDTPALSQATAKFRIDLAPVALDFSSDGTPQSLSSSECSFEDEAENDLNCAVSSNCELLRVLRIFRLFEMTFPFV